MSENKKTYPDGLYFVTLTIVGWINLFDRNCYKQILVENHPDHADGVNVGHSQISRERRLTLYLLMTNSL